jgi:dTDP-4-amino-4,6-dideoxygalactose transaminase
LGRQVSEFEAAFGDYCESTHCIGVGSGTDALLLTLKALGISPGDEVITAANTFVATAEAIAHLGALPVFVDIDPRTFHIDASRLADAITPKTRAIVPVHLYGQAVCFDPIRQIASERKLRIVEDAAQAHGARFKDRKVGSLGDAACFSFYPGKNLGAYGDGGAVVTSDDEIAAAVRKLRDHGGTAKYQHDVLGFTSRLDTLQAAALMIKLKHLDQWTARRQQLAQAYDRRLRDVPGIITPVVEPESTHVYHLYVIRVGYGQRDALQRYLAEQGIQTLIHYPRPVPELPPFRAAGARSFSSASQLAREILSLPLYPELEMQQLEFVAERLRGFMCTAADSEAEPRHQSRTLSQEESR